MCEKYIVKLILTFDEVLSEVIFHLKSLYCGLGFGSLFYIYVPHPVICTEFFMKIVLKLVFLYQRLKLLILIEWNLSFRILEIAVVLFKIDF